MKRGIVTVILALAACFLINGQVDYKSRGMAYVAKGNYVDAQSQFEAAKAVLQSKKVNQNASEFIDIEKKISYAKQCQTFSKQATSALNELTDAAIQDAFTQCNNELDADRAQESLLSTLEKAQSALSNIRNKFSSDEVTKANLDKCVEIKSKITEFRDNFSEVIAWNMAVESNTISALEEFLSAYPNGNFSAAAKEKISDYKEVLAWTEVCNTNTYESYIQYLKRFPSGSHSEEAKQTIELMEDELCWSANNKIGTTDSYNDYISRYPSGKYITNAKDRLKQCQENDFWESQSEKNTIAAYKNYLSKYPNGRYKTVAQNRIDKIGEASAWEKAVQENTIAGYQAYLNVSKNKAYKKEAEENIAKIKHEQEVGEDNARWAKIVNSTSSSDFYKYLSSSYYHGHEEEATIKYYTLLAREYPMDVENAQKIIDAYEMAENYTSLNSNDKVRLEKAKGLVSYQNFLKNKNIVSALSYLEEFPQGEHYQEVSDAVATIKANKMSMYVTQSEYQDAMSYAKSKDTRDYVQKVYDLKQKAYKKHTRSLTIEPIHYLLAVDGIAYKMNEGVAIDMAPVLSIGGRSNRLNLELGYYLRSGYAAARPRINLVKKNFLGKPGSTSRPSSQYSKFDLFIAPEFVYFVQPLTNDYSTVYDGKVRPTTYYSTSDNEEENNPLEYYPRLDYGARAGFGYGSFDFFVGYRAVSQSFYLGLTVNLSNK